MKLTYVDGKVKVNYPSSKTRSEKIWNLNEIEDPFKTVECLDRYLVIGNFCTKVRCAFWTVLLYYYNRYYGYMLYPIFLFEGR